MNACQLHLCFVCVCVDVGDLTLLSTLCPSAEGVELGA